MRFLRQNTATRVTVGPFLDKTDGITPETALTVTNEKLTFVVDDNGVPTLVLDAAPTASGGSNDMVHVTNDDAGFYDLELAAANVNYVGRAILSLTDAANHCPVFHEFMILPANVFDSLMGTDKLDVNSAELGGTSQTGRDIGASVLLAADQAVNVTKVNGTAQTARDLGGQLDAAISTRAAAATALTNATWTDVKAGYIDQAISTKRAVTLAAADVTGNLPANTVQIEGGDATNALNAATPASVQNIPVDGTLQVNAVKVGGTAQTGKDLGALNVTGINTLAGHDPGATLVKVADLPAAAPSESTVADAVWDELLAGHATAGSAGNALATASSGGVDPSVLADAIWDEALAGHGTAGTTGKKLTDLTNGGGLDAAGVRTAVGLASANLDTQLSGINTKTTNLPASPAASTDIPSAASIADAVLDEALAGHVTAGTLGKKVTDIPTSTPLDAAGTRTAIGLASANLDTQLGGINTKTTNLPAQPAAVGSAMALTAAYDAAKTAASQSSVDTMSTRVTTALPAAAPGANGGLPTTNGTKVNQTVDLTTGQSIAVSDKTGFSLSSAGADAVVDKVWDEALAGHVTAGTSGKALSDASAGGGASAAEIANAVWDEAVADHAGAGSSGAALAAAGASGDPWSTALPGAYQEGTAGNIIGNGLTADEKEALLDRVQAIVIDGSKREFTYTVTSGGIGLSGVVVTVYSDQAMTTSVTKGITDSFGNVTFALADGTYYLKSEKDGYLFSNPDTEVVSA